MTKNPAANMAFWARSTQRMPAVGLIRAHGQETCSVGRCGKSDSESGMRRFLASAKSAGRLHSGTKFDRCQLCTVVGGIFAFEATVA